MSTPFFSVIIPTYNRAKFIGKAIESVLTQTFTDFEVIIVDAASTDNTDEIVKAFNDNRISYIKNTTNQERCANRNIGIKNAKGQYICFLDSDDYHLKNHLDVLHKHITNDNYPKAVYFTNTFNETNNQLSKREVPNINTMNIYKYILQYTFGLHRTAIHKDILKEFLLDEHLKACEDLDLFSRIATKHPINHIEEVTTVIHFHNKSFTLGNPLKPFIEHDSYKRIFFKEILKNKLPKQSKKRLLSMCYYFFAVQYEREKKWLKMYQSIIKSFFLYPKSYNGKTNKIMLVMFVYHLPLIGLIIKLIKKSV